MIYFDYTATTRPLPEVVDIYNEVANKYWYNASSMYKVGQIANQLLTQATDTVLRATNSTNKKVVFSSSATEASNIAILGLLDGVDGNGKRVITTKIEHPSVLNCFKELERRGFLVTYLDVDHNGVIDLTEFAKTIDQNTVLVSVMWVNNIIGSIQPIEEVINITKKYPRTRLHVDAVQGFGKIKPSFSFDDVDLLTFSAHKINGLKGVGVLLYNQKLMFTSPLKGSNQQNGLKPGTIDVAAACACAKAMKLASERQNEHYEKVLEINNYFKNKITNISNIIINGARESYSPYIINISIPPHNSETILHALERYDIYIAAGSACNAKSKKPERTVQLITKNDQLALSSLRISFSHETTKNEIDILIEKLQAFTCKTK